MVAYELHCATDGLPLLICFLSTSRVKKNSLHIFLTRIATSNCLVRPVARCSLPRQVKERKGFITEALMIGDNSGKIFLVKIDSVCTRPNIVCSASEFSSRSVIDLLLDSTTFLIVSNLHTQILLLLKEDSFLHILEHLSVIYKIIELNRYLSVFRRSTCR